MRVLVVDDEALARQRLIRLLQNQSTFEVVGEAQNGEEALQHCQTLEADIVLLDIRMPGIDGLQAAQHMARWAVPPAVIFCSAFDDHALEAFAAHAIDYVLKPVTQERLLEALHKASRGNRAQLLQWARPQTPQKQHLSVRLANETRMIPIHEICYFMADQKYVRLRTASEELLIEPSLKDLEAEWGQVFLRIHRNALVAVHCIAGLKRQKDGSHRLQLQGLSETLEISRRHLPHVRRLLKSL